ncbi:MAG: 50S ribosomal protein L21 [Acidobacteria bacterium]|nr:50S ribosomal protein L21 [Acidobacteriota bacterium]
MYAVIETGGKQYRVQPGDLIDIELISGVESSGAGVEFDRVLAVSDGDAVKVGSPVVEGARVTGVLVNEVRGPKVLVFKMKRRKQYRRRRGHRQDLMRVRIEGIEA